MAALDDARGNSYTFTMPYVTLPQQQIYYAKQGNGRYPLILIHGAGGSHLVWPAALRQLANAAVYALDLPGHGRSNGPAHDNVNAYANLVADFLAALDLKNVVLVGHSMGGAVAQMAAVQHPSRIAGLVLIGTGARLPVSSAILDQALTDFEATTAFINKYQWAKDTPDTLRQLAAAQLAQTDPAVLHADFLACDRFDLRPQLHTLTRPTLIIGGTADKMTPIKFSQFLADELPQATLVTLPEAGHMMMLERPNAVATAVTSFLTQLYG